MRATATNTVIVLTNEVAAARRWIEVPERLVDKAVAPFVRGAESDKLS
jgi:hypothetical protein